MAKRSLGLALGTNLGNRIANLRSAIKGILSFCDDKFILTSSVFETAPVDCPPGSESFYNAVIQVYCSLEPEEVLEKCQALEKRLGRPEERELHAPRVIDIDILYYGDLKLSLPGFALPHPRISERRFVLHPLCEIRPGLILPGGKKSIEEILADLKSNEPIPHVIYPNDSWL